MIFGRPITESGGGALPITLPVPDLASGAIYNSVTHPDVVYIPGGFGDGDHTYWMAITPYPDFAREEPCIFCSHDGVTWETPSGLTNPVARRAEAIAALGSGSITPDPDLVYANGVLYLFYLRANGSLDWQWVRRTSTNGRAWSDPVVVLSGASPPQLSPAFVHEGGNTFTGFYVKGIAAGTPTIHYRTSTDLGRTWSTESNCTFPKCSDNRPDFWHMDVIKVGDKYHALVLSKTSSEGFLWYYTSTDKASWTLESFEPAIPYSSEIHDGAGHYRSTFVAKEGGKFDIWVTMVPRGATSDDAAYWPDLAATCTSASPGVFTSTGGAHLWATNDEVRIVGGTAPTGLTSGTTYYVKRLNNTTFEVSATKGGASINTSSTGSNIRLNRNPWRISLLRNVELPVQPKIVACRKSLTNINQGGISIMAPAASITGAIAAWPTANLGFANRFSIQTPVELRYASIPCTVANGNIEIGILRCVGADRTTVAPLITSAVIACPAPSGGRIRVDLGRFVLTPGEYWAWLWCDNTTATFPAIGLGYGGVFHIAQYSAAAAGGRAMPIAGASLDATGGRALAHLVFEGDYA